MKTLAELKADCAALGLTVAENGRRASKEPYLAALRDHHWRRDHPGEPLPTQISPMLLGDWGDLDPEEARRIEHEPGWVVQPKFDGVRALLHIEGNRVRITSRCVSGVTYRVGEFQDNLPHLTTGLSALDGTILDGELVFPGSSLDTGRTVARHPLQAATAILSTSPEQARQFQSRPEHRLRFHAFDILKYRDAVLTELPLRDRLDFLARAIDTADNPHLEPVPTFAIGRLSIHRHILTAGGEGTVWKRLDQPYEPGRRVGHWLKRKRETRVQAIVTGFKPGTPGHGHEDLVGALEFSTRHADGRLRPIAWVSTWSDPERRAMTRPDRTGTPSLDPAYLGRRALITGQDEAARSGRLRHARLHRWFDEHS
jgi:ATP-dependent DNA ligase